MVNPRVLALVIISTIILSLSLVILHARNAVDSPWLEWELTDYCRVERTNAGASWDGCEAWAYGQLDNVTIHADVQQCVTTKEHYSGAMRACIRQVIER